MMVTRWGLSDALGTITYAENQEEVFLGYSAPTAYFRGNGTEDRC